MQVCPRRRTCANNRLPARTLSSRTVTCPWHGWFVSGGTALIDRDSDVLSGHGQFYTGVGHAGPTWALSLRHLSNGDTGGGNLGETFMLLEHRF